jgi:HSP20 family protein
MAITRYSPMGEIMTFDRDLDRLFGRLLSAPIEPLVSTSAWVPRTDVIKRGEDLVVRAELPGLRPEDVDVSVTEGLLTIRGERREEKESEDKGYVIRESRFGTFERSVSIPTGVDSSAVNADFHDGVLEVTVPKALALSEPKSVKVEVRGEEPTGTGQMSAEGATGEKSEGSGAAA